LQPRAEIHEIPDKRGYPWLALRVRLAKPIPLELGLVAGDAIHNMRSALDHLVCRLVELNGHKAHNRKAFPIYENRPAPSPKKSRTNYKGPLDGLRHDHRASVIALQPFKRKGTAEARRLVVLGALDNLDKHQLVVPVVGSMQHRPGSPDTVLSRAFEFQRAPRDLPVTDEAEMVRYRPRGLPGEVLTFEWEFKWDMTFGHPEATSNVFKAMRTDVVGIIESFAPDFG